MNKHSFDLLKLLHDLVGSDCKIRKWQDLEQLVVNCCRKQDPKARHNTETDPDVSLTNGFGIEAKSTTSLTRSINLNSAAPDPKTYYAVVYHAGQRIKNVALVSGELLYCPEIADIKKTNTGLRPLSNKFLKYRTRIMWQMQSPFETWGKGSFVADKNGEIHRY